MKTQHTLHFLGQNIRRCYKINNILINKYMYVPGKRSLLLRSSFIVRGKLKYIF